MTLTTIATIILTVLISLAVLFPPLLAMWRVLERIGKTPPPSPQQITSPSASGARLTMMDMGNSWGTEEARTSKVTQIVRKPKLNLYVNGALRGSAATDDPHRVFDQSVNQ